MIDAQRYELFVVSTNSLNDIVLTFIKSLLYKEEEAGTVTRKAQRCIDNAWSLANGHNVDAAHDSDDSYFFEFVSPTMYIACIPLDADPSMCFAY